MAQEADEKTIERYLLGELNEAEREALEERYFTDDDIFTQVQTTEMAMIDRYVRGGMSMDETRQMEHGFIQTPERRAKVAEAKAFHNELAALRKPSSSLERPSLLARILAYWSLGMPQLQFAAVSLVLILAAAVGWLVYDRSTTQRELELARNSQARTETIYQEQLAAKERELAERLTDERAGEAETLASLEGEIERLRRQLDEARRRPANISTQDTPQRVPLIATVTLPMTPTSGTGPPVLVAVEDETKVISFQVPVSETEGDSFEVTVKKGAETLLKAENVKPRSAGTQRTVSVSLPTRQLSDGRYDVVVKGNRGEARTRGFIVTRELK